MKMKRFTLAILLIALTVCSVYPVIAADELKEAQNKKAAADNRIADLTKKKQAELQEKAKLEKQKEELAKQQREETNAIEELEKQIAEAKEHLRQTELALAQATAEYNQMDELVKTRLQVMYKNSGTSLLDTLLSSGSVVEFYERLHYMQVVSENDSRLMQQLEEARLDVELKKQMQEQAKALLEEKLKEREERLEQIKTSRARVEGEITRTQKEIQQLEKEIDRWIEESKKLASQIKALSSKNKYVGGSMTWPCPSSYRVTSTFGMRKHPILRKYKMHTGVDIAADKGAAIVAANSGTVIMAGYDNTGYGNMVVIDHGGGITTLYAHASKLLVKVGDKVKAGQTIAKVGSTGLSTGNHLHFEVRVNGEPVDPMKGYLKAK